MLPWQWYADQSHESPHDCEASVVAGQVIEGCHLSRLGYLVSSEGDAIGNVPAGGNQMSPDVSRSSVRCRILSPSVLWSLQRRNDLWDVLQKQKFLPANTSSPYRW